jgi:hypothetical protein
MQEKKRGFKGRGLKTAFNSFMAHTKKPASSLMTITLGPEILSKVIEPCVRNHAENPNFPADDLREEINGLREAVGTRNVHKVHTHREQIEDLLSPWKGKQSDINVRRNINRTMTI